MRRTFHKSSDFREQIELIKYALTYDETGGTVPTYESAYNTFAKVKPYDGQLSIQGGERVGNNKYEFIVRYRNSLTYDIPNLWNEFFAVWSENSQFIDKTYKIGYRNKQYIIHSVIIEDERNYFLRIIGWLKS